MKITLHDINNEPLNLNDWCKVALSRNNTNGGKKLLTFYVPVKIIEGGRLQPFDNYCFDQINKINFSEIPKDAVKSNSDYYVVYKGEEAEPEDKRKEYMFEFMKFNLTRKFYSITEA